MRVAYLGNDPWSVPPLRTVAASRHRVVLVATRDPRPAGRGGDLRRTPVAEAASQEELPVVETATVKGGDGLDRLRASRPDVLAVVAYGEILPGEILSLPRVAPVNVHFSLLPALRGADPVRRAILEGLEATGVTTIRMDEGLDTGPILLQAEEPVRGDDDGGSLGSRLAHLGGRVLVETLDRLEDGRIEERPQDEAGASRAPKLRPEEEWIDWAEPAEAVWRRVRALAPAPGARARFQDRVVKLLRVSPVDGDGEPGNILEATDDRFTVACGGGAVALEEVVPEGRKRMSGPDFVRGQRPEVGEVFHGRPTA
jgi:methionyl-tRNA formyltransferase